MPQAEAIRWKRESPGLAVQRLFSPLHRPAAGETGIVAVDDSHVFANAINCGLSPKRSLCKTYSESTCQGLRSSIWRTPSLKGSQGARSYIALLRRLGA